MTDNYPDDDERSAVRRSRIKRLVWGAAIALVVAAAVAVNLPDSPDEGSVDARRDPPPTTQADPDPRSTVQLHQPFVGSPAADWKDGISGITFAKPKVVGDFTKAQVAAAMKAVEKTIVAANLDRRVIEDHDFKRYLGTLAPDARSSIEKEDLDPLGKAGYVVLIDPDHPLLPASPKTSGRVTYRVGADDELLFTAKFSVAYAFDTARPDELTDPLDIVSVSTTHEKYHVYEGPQWLEEGRGVHPGEADGEVYSMSCEAIEKGYLAPYIADPQEAIGARDDEHYFDPSRSVADAPDNC